MFCLHYIIFINRESVAKRLNLCLDLVEARFLFLDYASNKTRNLTAFLFLEAT